MDKVKSFFNEVKVEMTKIVWPSREQVMQLTLNVIVISIIIGAFLGVLDYVMTITSQSFFA